VGSITADISRVTRFESSGFEAPTGDGETLGASFRVGTSLGNRWGVEFELARGAELETESSLSPRILASDLLFTFTPGGTSVPSPTQLAPIALNYRLRTRQQHLTLGTVAWVRQSVGRNTDLVYFAGAAFVRSRFEQNTSFGLGAGLPAGLILPFPQTTELTRYGVGPLAGFEARIGLTDRVRLVPGIRLQTLDTDTGGGWLLRPGVGLGWFF
jgi:hypothetical protein